MTTGGDDHEPVGYRRGDEINPDQWLTGTLARLSTTLYPDLDIPLPLRRD